MTKPTQLPKNQGAESGSAVGTFGRPSGFSPLVTDRYSPDRDFADTVRATLSWIRHHIRKPSDFTAALAESHRGRTGRHFRSRGMEGRRRVPLLQTRRARV
jgi:hypothetical protein